MGTFIDYTRRLDALREDPCAFKVLRAKSLLDLKGLMGRNSKCREI